MTSQLDPMQDNTRKLAESLTTARARAQSPGGHLIVEACADGQVFINIDDRALGFGGPAISAELTRLAAEALAKARVGVKEALDAFTADPRIAQAIERTEDAMGRAPITAAPVASKPSATRFPRAVVPAPQSGEPPATGETAAWADEDDFYAHRRRTDWISPDR